MCSVKHVFGTKAKQSLLFDLFLFFSALLSHFYCGYPYTINFSKGIVSWLVDIHICVGACVCLCILCNGPTNRMSIFDSFYGTLKFVVFLVSYGFCKHFRFLFFCSSVFSVSTPYFFDFFHFFCTIGHCFNCSSFNDFTFCLKNEKKKKKQKENLLLSLLAGKYVSLNFFFIWLGYLMWHKSSGALQFKRNKFSK